jgi:hypothetical protein
MPWHIPEPRRQADTFRFPGPSWHDIVHVLPDVFPDIEEENKQEAQKLGRKLKLPRAPACAIISA